MTKIVYAFQPDSHHFVYPVTLDDSDLSPLEEGVYLIPANCLEEAPPTIPQGMVARAVNGSWVLEDIPVPQPYVQPPPPEMPAPVQFDPASFLNLPQPRAPEIQDDQTRLMNAVQKYMDTMAQGFGYDSIATAVTYAEEPAVAKFQQEGQAFRAWRSIVWARCYELLDEVLSGIRSVPSEQQLIALLPQFTTQE